MTLNRHRRAAYLLMLLLPITLSLSVALAISGFAYVSGGIPLVYKTWTEKPHGNINYPIPALWVGVPIGIVSGYQLWTWIVKKLNY